jgi:hypothetical protein
MAAGLTSYRGPAGKSMLFETANSGVGKRIRDIVDGTSQTVMIVEVAAGLEVPWTKPDTFDPGPDPRKTIIGDADGFFAALCDGSVRWIPKTIKPASLAGILTINGNETVEIP